MKNRSTKKRFAVTNGATLDLIHFKRLYSKSDALYINEFRYGVKVGH
jgi:hypothetical protein